MTRFGEAEAAYRQALAQLPDDGDLHRQLGHLLKLLGRIKEAIAAYSAAHHLLPGNEAPAVKLRALGAAIGVSGADTVAIEEHIRDGDRLRDARRCVEAADAYGKALSLSPTRSDIRIQQGNMLKDAGRLAEAEATYRCALAQMPEDAEIHLQLGHVLKLQGRRTDALLAYRRAIEIRPTLEAAWNELFQAVTLQSDRGSSEPRAGRGGAKALLAMTAEVVRAVTRLTKALPGLYAELAFPIASYDRFRTLFDIAVPPPASTEPSFGIVLTVAGMVLERIYASLRSAPGATPIGSYGPLAPTSLSTGWVERAAISDPRIRWIEGAEDEQASVAERRIAAALSTDWIVLPRRGALLHSHALAWFAAIVGHGAAKAFVTDEERVSREGGTPR